MTDLLHAKRSSSGSAPDAAPRPLALAAAVGGLAAAGSVLVCCLALALAGWFASDAASYGETTDALRVGADAWLLAHGAHLQLARTAVGIVPLGLTALSLYVTYRLGRWAGATSDVRGDDGDARSVLLGGVVLAGVYGLVALVTAALASSPVAEPHLGRAFAGGFAVGLLGGGPGIVAGSRHGGVWWRRLPEGVRTAVLGGLAGPLLLGAASAAVLAAALLVHLGAAATVLSRLHVDTAGALLYTVVVAAVTPNAVLLATSYVLGPGFALGAGTVVSPSAVVLGPVPAFPLLAALPAPGAGPWEAQGYLAVPLLAGAVAAVLAVRRCPRAGWSAGLLRGGVAGLLGGLLVTAAVALAGGAVGPGRMQQVGSFPADVFVAALVTMGVGGLVGGLVGTWWGRRREAGTDAAEA